MAIIALFLALNGVQHIGIGEDYYSFMKSVSRDFENFKIEIPNIPKIPTITKKYNDSEWAIINAIFTIINVIINFFNGVISVLNVTILIFNIVLQVLEFIVLLLWKCKDFIAQMVEKWVT